MMHDSGDMGWGFGMGHGVFGLLAWIVLILAIAALIKYLFSRNKD